MKHLFLCKKETTELIKIISSKFKEVITTYKEIQKNKISGLSFVWWNFSWVGFRFTLYDRHGVDLKTKTFTIKPCGFVINCGLFDIIYGV